MTAPTQYYCDPVTASNAGDGTSTPWSRASENAVQYAIDNLSADATNGVQINVKSGTPHGAGNLGAQLNLTSCAHTPTAGAPLRIQGYDAESGDGGIGEIDGGGTYGCFNASQDYIVVADMDIGNCGSQIALDLNNYCAVVRCQLHGTTNNIVSLDINGFISDCYIYNGGSYGVDLGTVCHCFNNYFTNGANIFSNAIAANSDCVVSRNIISISGASIGIRAYDPRNIQIINNSILSSGGSGNGIFMRSVNSRGRVINNLIEGFTTGNGIDFTVDTGNREIYANNAFYGCGTNEANKDVGEWLIDEENTALSASPFAKSGADTWANRFIYFTPVDTDSDIFGGSWPTGSNLDKGAVQHAAAAATTTTYFII